MPWVHTKKIQQNITKQTPIIGQHDSHSQFCLFLYNRLTLTVYNLTVWHWHSEIGTVVGQTKHLVN